MGAEMWTGKVRHGTPGGYRKHRRLDEAACCACATALTEHNRERMSDPERLRKGRQAANVQSRAKARLSHLYPDTYRALYLEEMSLALALDGAA
jgi:hypothetical protein